MNQKLKLSTFRFIVDVGKDDRVEKQVVLQFLGRDYRTKMPLIESLSHIKYIVTVKFSTIDID